MSKKRKDLESDQVTMYVARKLESSIEEYLSELGNFADVEGQDYILDYHQANDHEIYFNLVFEGIEGTLNFRMVYEEGFKNEEGLPIRDYEFERVAGPKLRFHNIMSFLSNGMGAIDEMEGDSSYGIITPRDNY